MVAGRDVSQRSILRLSHLSLDFCHFHYISNTVEGKLHLYLKEEVESDPYKNWMGTSIQQYIQFCKPFLGFISPLSGIIFKNYKVYSEQGHYPQNPYHAIYLYKMQNSLMYMNFIFYILPINISLLALPSPFF